MAKNKEPLYWFSLKGGKRIPVFEGEDKKSALRREIDVRINDGKLKKRKDRTEEFGKRAYELKKSGSMTDEQKEKINKAYLDYKKSKNEVTEKMFDKEISKAEGKEYGVKVNGDLFKNRLRSRMSKSKEETIVKENSLLDDKQKKLEIIKKENAMTDDFHTGIRSVDDILTFEEAMNSD